MRAPSVIANAACFDAQYVGMTAAGDQPTEAPPSVTMTSPVLNPFFIR